MRILHTSDWHLGKSLEGYSRIEEQEKFIDELIEIIEEKDIEMVIIAGDIYDNSNPPARAEKLFYHALKRISKDGKRAVLVIAGNHDNPDRLVASSPLAYEHGIILLGTPKNIAPKGVYGNVEILDAGEGYVELQMKEERAIILALPYPSEKRLNEIFTEELEEEARQKSYSERIGQLFEQLSAKYRKDTINLVVSHLFLAGGQASESERPIQLGGSLAVHIDQMPAQAQYIALGHLHRPQKIVGKHTTAHYAGSPIQYSKSEINYSKCVYIADIEPGREAIVQEVMIKNHKPIEVWHCDGIAEALAQCEEHQDRDCWVYLEIKTDRVLTQAEIKELRTLKQDIVEIVPKFDEKEIESDYEDPSEKGMGQLFKEFYRSQRQVEPTEELLDLFYDIIQEQEEEGELDEAAEA